MTWHADFIENIFLFFVWEPPLQPSQNLTSSVGFSTFKRYSAIAPSKREQGLNPSG